jgi:hypothetical protein
MLNRMHDGLRGWSGWPRAAKPSRPVIALQAAASSATAVEYGLIAASQFGVPPVFGLRRKDLDLR